MACTDSADDFIARLRVEGNRWRETDQRPEVRAVATGLSVRVTERRFRLWLEVPGNQPTPVMDGEVLREGPACRVRGRIRHSYYTQLVAALWVGASAYIAITSASGRFVAVLALGAGAVLLYLLGWRVRERAAVLHSLIASLASPEIAVPASSRAPDA